MSQVSRTSRWEWGAIAAMTALGALLRCWSLGSVGLNHFDEGIYALSGLWMLRPGGIAAIDSTLIPYAPPGLAIVIGLAYSVAGVSDLAAVAGPLAFGIATIPLAAWVGRRTFGPGAGAAAAAMAALCGPHVAFSRMAMTDVPFLFWWLLAMLAGGRFLEKPRWGSALALGIAVGLAQTFKYNGWLAGIVVALVVLLDLVSGRLRSFRSIVVVLGLGAVAAAVAVLLYLPWFGFVESHAGYSKLLEHHRSYMGGLTTWLPYWRAQLAQRVALSGGRLWSATSWLLAWCSAAVVSDEAPLRNRAGRVQVIAGAISGALLFALVPSLSWWAGLAAVAWLFRDARPAARLLAVWWLVLSIMTPFYHPYARLWLPLDAAGWIILAGLVRDATASVSFAAAIRSSRRFQVVVLVAALALAEAWLIPPRANPVPGLLAPSNGVRQAVATLASDPRRRLMVLARPVVTFYLVTEGSTPFDVVQGLPDMVPRGSGDERALVDEAVLGLNNPIDRALGWLLQRWQVERRIEVPLSLPTLLDVDPGAAHNSAAPRTRALLLLKRRSP